MLKANQLHYSQGQIHQKKPFQIKNKKNKKKQENQILS